MAPRTVDSEALASAICRGIQEGNRPLVDALQSDGKRIHDFRNTVETNTGKIYEHDTEIRMLKGIVVGLMGNGDGTSGIIPRLTNDVASLKADVASVRSDVGQMAKDISGVREILAEVREAQTKQGTWTDQVKGGALAAKFVIGAAITTIGGIITALIFLFEHGVKP